MRLTEDVTEQLFAQADVWFSGAASPSAEIRTALASIAALYDEHGVLLRAIVEVSTYDEEVARFWRGLIGRFVEATARRIEGEQAAGEARAGPAAGDRVRAVWMTERTFYQRLVQEHAARADELVERARAASGCAPSTAAERAPAAYGPPRLERRGPPSPLHGLDRRSLARDVGVDLVLGGVGRARRIRSRSGAGT